MKKILLLTKNNPIEIYDVMMRLYRSKIYTSDTLFFSPQYTAMLAAEKMKVSYLKTFYSGIVTWESKKEEVLEAHPEFKTIVVVGTVDANSLPWFDAVISLDNPNIDDYPIDEAYNLRKTKILTTEDGEVKFNNLDEAITFIAYVQKQNNEGGKEDAVQ